jgi:predicted RecA/RadA family phage recombinase
MPADATPTTQAVGTTQQTAAAAVPANDLRQYADGRAAVYNSSFAAAAGDSIRLTTTGQFVLPKQTSTVILDGGRVYWDRSAGVATYKKVGDRDFYVGRAIGDAASNDTELTVDLNVDPAYDVDLLRDPYLTVPIGTQALGGFVPPARNGGSLTMILSATNEAQKLDALGIETFSKDANAIVELEFRVPSDGAGTVVDVSLGISNGTHATDFASVTNYLVVHLDANATPINLESKDGTTTVAITDTTTDYTEGSAIANRVYVWFDMRNPADVQCYVNGVLVLGATVFDVSAAGSEFRLVAHIEKTASTDTYELAVDRLCARFAEQ